MSELGSFFHGPHSKQGDVSKILQFLSIRVEVHLCKLYSRVGTFIKKQLERKAKPIIANPKANIVYKAKNVDLAQTITNEK